MRLSMIILYVRSVGRACPGGPRPGGAGGRARGRGRPARRSRNPNRCPGGRARIRKTGAVGSSAMATPLRVVGIDVAKAHRDIAVRPTEAVGPVANAPAGSA